MIDSLYLLNPDLFPIGKISTAHFSQSNKKGKFYALAIASEGIPVYDPARIPFD
jgi:hypothetical protein